jgi:two-component system cell cycle sensor histidine kinase/response regulator CckA
LCPPFGGLTFGISLDGFQVPLIPDALPTALATGLVVFLALSLYWSRRRTAAAGEELRAARAQLRREVAARESAEQAQRRTEERYRTPADQVKDYAIFIMDDQGRHRSWNEGVHRMLGYEKAEFLAATSADLFTPEDRAAGLPEQELAEAIAHDRSTGDQWLVRKDGSQLWASVSTARVNDRHGQLLGFAKRIRDLSEMRRVEEELRRNQEALELAHEAAALGTWDHDLLTGELKWDARARALFGIRADDATLPRWADVIHPDDLATTEQRQRNALAERKPFSAEYRVVWPDRTVHWIAAEGRGVEEPSGGATRMRGILLDITERKETEQRLEEVLRLEAIGRLAGGIAHDLNNMLAAILGFGDLLAQSFAVHDARRSDVDEIVRAARRSAELTRQLLAFARRELIQPRPLDLNAVVHGAETILRPVLGENVTLSLALAPDCGVIYADRARVEQILINLVLNARDAMPRGGRVTVETGTLSFDDVRGKRRVDADAPETSRYVMLAVRDTGHGMDAATLQRMWEPFFTTKPAGHGTGLGLSMVYGSVKQGGGFVWAESTPGEGTVIQAYWPEFHGQAEELPREGDASPVRGGSERILVVEDDAVLRALSVRTLMQQGYACMAAESAEEGLAMLRAGAAADLLITDVVMPGMSGGSLGELLEREQPGLPILYTSGFAGEDIVRRGLLAADRPFLQKPFTPGELARKAREVLDRAAAGGPRARAI